jgi:hypothetical protein
MCRENAALFLNPLDATPLLFPARSRLGKAHDKFTVAVSTAGANDPHDFPNSFLDTSQDGKVPALSLIAMLQG